MRSPLDVDAVRAAVGAAWPVIEVVDETSSTNADLLAGADRRGDREVLVAEHQTSGRGRFERAWTSPPRAGLLFSMLVRPAVPLTGWGWLPLLAGVALAEAVGAEPIGAGAVGGAAVLKWPNDLLLGEQQRKAAGILVQTAGSAAVIGIGLNVSLTADELPVEGSTSLAVEGATDPDRAMLLAEVLRRMDGWLERWSAAGGDARVCGLAARYRGLCATLGRRVRVELSGGRPVFGDAVDLDDSGRLVVVVDGHRHAVGAGDVVHLRPV